MIAMCMHSIGREFVADAVVVVKAATPDGRNAVLVRTACEQCRADYERMGLILHDENEEAEWMRQK